ncbi:hypothetical protein KJ969_03085 [Patescibacteria group bacterium]|nr:hypothetical protein [Patescibacteria group bacterium]MBU1921744.1 hypothetical protein [Patescibacteria group bacterium]
MALCILRLKYTGRVQEEFNPFTHEFEKAEIYKIVSLRGEKPFVCREKGRRHFEAGDVINQTEIKFLFASGGVKIKFFGQDDDFFEEDKEHGGRF